MNVRLGMALGVVLATLVLALDQLSKWVIVSRVMQPPRVIEVTPFFNLVMGWNRGISFGLFNSGVDWGAWVLTGVALGISGVLAVWMSRTKRVRLVVALAFVIGGAIGNAVDRVRFGAVADFLDVHFAGYHWPAFNVADSAITLGAIILVLDALFAPKETPTNNDAQESRGPRASR